MLPSSCGMKNWGDLPKAPQSRSRASSQTQPVWLLNTMLPCTRQKLGQDPERRAWMYMVALRKSSGREAEPGARVPLSTSCFRVSQRSALEEGGWCWGAKTGEPFGAGQAGGVLHAPLPWGGQCSFFYQLNDFIGKHIKYTDKDRK